MEPDSTNIVDLAQERRRRGPRFDGGLMDILEVSRDMVCLCRDGAITAINGAGVRMLGAKTTEELVGRPMGEFLLPDYGPVLDLFLAGMSSEDKAVPTRIMGLDKTCTDVELQVFRARELAKGATVVVCRERSTPVAPRARRGHEAELKAHLMVDQVTAMVCLVQDGIIRHINRPGLSMLGVDKAQAVLGHELADLFHADYADVLQPHSLISLAAEGKSLPLRLRRRQEKGGARENAGDCLVTITRLPSADEGEVMVEVRDISGHSRAMAALCQSNEKLEGRIARLTQDVDDLRARLRDNRDVHQAGRQFTQAILDSMPDPVWISDARGQLDIANPAFLSHFCPDQDGAKSFPESPLSPSLPADDAVAQAELLAGLRQQAHLELTMITVGGARDWCVDKQVLLDGDGRICGVASSARDVTRSRAQDRDLRRLSRQDTLTGTHARGHFLALASVEWGRSLRYGHPLSLVVIRVDHLRALNAGHGHDAGDLALRLVAATCRQSLRDLDCLGRLSGAEFVALLPETPIGMAQEVAERLRRRIAAIQWGDGIGGADGTVPPPLTASLGVAGSDGAENLAAVLSLAEQAAGRAKMAGCDRVETA